MARAIDPRLRAAGAVAIRGGKGGYQFPGMMSASHWARTWVHRLTRQYSCAFCAQGFNGPHAVYTHVAKRHPGRTLPTPMEAQHNARAADGAAVRGTVAVAG